MEVTFLESIITELTGFATGLKDGFVDALPIILGVVAGIMIFRFLYSRLRGAIK